MENDSSAALDAYLSREYANLGGDFLASIKTVDNKLHLKRTREHLKIWSSLSRQAHIVCELTPSFTPEWATLGRDLTDAEARRPFDDRFAGREAGIRAGLLPDNPYFADDAALVREVLGLPSEGIKAVPATDIPKEYGWWREFAPLGVRLLSSLWEDIHIAKVKGESYRGPELPAFIPNFLRDYLAVNKSVPRDDKAPEWLNNDPQLPWGRPAGYREDLPLHRYLGTLLYRYGLPPRLFGKRV